MHQVSGTVTYKDGTVPKAGVCLVRFEPTSGSTAQIRKGATSAIAEDGSFELWTRKPGDGVNPGEYAAVFTVCKGVMDTTPLILEKYANPNLTPYKVTVDDDKTDLKFEIEPLPGGAGGAASSDGRTRGTSKAG